MIYDTKKIKKKTDSQFNSHLDNFVYQQCTTKTPSFLRAAHTKRLVKSNLDLLPGVEVQ